MTTSGDASVYYALPLPEASAPPTVRWVTPGLEHVTRIPHSGVAVHRVYWFLRRVYPVRLVLLGGDYWGVWVQPPSLAALVSLPCACNTFTPHLHPGGSTVHIDQRQPTQSARLTPLALCLYHQHLHSQPRLRISFSNHQQPRRCVVLHCIALAHPGGQVTASAIKPLN